jgi:hypothetical protein
MNKNMTRVTSLIALLLASLLSSCNPIKSSRSAEAAVVQFHTQLDKGEFADIYKATHPEFKKVSDEKSFTELLAAVHRKLGLVRSSEKSSWNVNSYNLKTNVILTYSTKFAEGTGTETFTYRIDGDKALLLGYNINSQDLITK